MLPFGVELASLVAEPWVGLGLTPLPGTYDSCGMLDSSSCSALSITSYKADAASGGGTRPLVNLGRRRR